MRRRIDEAGASRSALATIRDTPAALAEAQPEEDTLDVAHRLLGNDAWAASVVGSSGPGALMAAQWSLGAAGVQVDGGLLGGNQAMLRVMRKATPLTEQQLDAARIIESATGSPLPEAVRARMERAFGHDFRHVRVHTDSRAAQAAQGMSAHAVTVGAHIYFNQGEYQPGSLSGDRLLLHELTHVVQNDENRLPAGGGVSQPTDRSEVEAYRNEDLLYSRLDDLSLDDAAPSLGEGDQGVQGGDAAASLAAAPVLRQEGEDADATDDGERSNPDIPVDEIVARTIQPLQQTEEVAAAILEEKQLRQEQGVEDNLPEVLPAELTSSQPEGEGQGAPPIGLQLQSPTQQAPAAIEGMQITPGEVSASVAIAVPQVQEAWGRYSAAATTTLSAIATAGTGLNTAISGAISTASQQLVTRASTLKTDLAARILTASGSIDTYKAEAHAALLVKFNERKAELTTEKDAVLATLDTNVQGYRTAITEKTTELSAALETLGSDHAATVTQEAERLSGEATALGEEQRAHWANEASWEAIDNDYDAELAADVGLYAVNTARSVAQEIVNAAADVIEDFREDGVELAADLRENGTEYAEEFDGKVEEVRQWYNDDLPNAEQRLQTEYDNAKGQIDTTAEDLKGDLTDLETELSGQLDEGVAAISGQLELAGITAQEAIRLAIADATTAIQDQVAEVEAWLGEADPSHWPALVEVLDQMAAELEAEVPTVVSQIQQVGDDLVSAISQGGTDAVGAIDTLWGQVDGQIATFETNAQTTLVTDVVNQIDEQVLQAKVANERQGWDEQRGRHETELEKASGGFVDELQKEHDEGKTNLDEKKSETLEEMASPLDTLREELAADCRFMAESPWRARLAQFGEGLLSAVVSFLKVLAVIVLVVIVIAAIIALVLGFEVVLAIAAAIAAFVATYSAIIGAIAAILTVISIVLAAIPMIMDFIGMAQGTTSSFEASNSFGNFFGTVLTEVIPDMGIAALTSGGKVVNAVDAPSDIAQGIRGLNAIDETASGITNFSEEVVTAASNAGKVDELVEVVAAGENTGNALEEMATTANAVEEVLDTASDGANAVENVGSGVNAVEETVDTTTDTVNATEEVLDTSADTANATEEVVDTTADTANATEEVVDTGSDAANATEEVSGSLRSDSPQYAAGKRFDPVTNRWVKPDDLDQWAAYIQAKNNGFDGRFTQFRTATRSGQIFDPVSGNMIAPPPVSAVDNVGTGANAIEETVDATADTANATEEVVDTTVDTANATEEVVDTTVDTANATEEVVDTTVDTANATEEVVDTTVDTANATEEVVDTTVDTANATEEVVDTTVDTANATEEVVDTAGDTAGGGGPFDELRYTSHGFQGPIGLLPPFGKGDELMGNWAAVQAAYDALKGVAASLWLVVNNGAPVNDMGGIATYVTERDAELSDLEAAAGE